MIFHLVTAKAHIQFKRNFVSFLFSEQKGDLGDFRSKALLIPLRVVLFSFSFARFSSYCHFFTMFPRQYILKKTIDDYHGSGIDRNKNDDDAKDEKDEVLLHRQVQSDGIRKHNMSK